MDPCLFHLATLFAAANGTRLSPREPVLCDGLVPAGADVCPACGQEAPGARLARIVRTYDRDPHQGGDVEATAKRMRSRSAARRATRKAAL